MNFDFKVGGEICFSAEIGYVQPPPAPPADLKPLYAYVINDSAGDYVFGNAEPLEV